MARVFLIEPTTKDISKAESHGDIITLFPSNQERPSVFDTDEFQLALLKRLEKEEFEPKSDYILSVGQTIPLNLAFHAIGKHVDESVRVLFFHAQIGEYVSKILK